MIEFQHVDKTFTDPQGNEIAAVRGLDLTIERGETHCLIGTSGCGKTTTLRMANRLEEPSAGRILLEGEDVASVDVYALRRGVGYVIQTGGLFPHMTVVQNVGVMAELEGWVPETVEARVNELLELVNLPAAEFGARYPGELSGGQRQRVGVARALVLDPTHVLMDEPFGALDPITRAQIHDEFRQLQDRVTKTILMVTHDLGEAFKLADRLTIMNSGKALQTGTPTQIVEDPANEFVAEFVAGHRSEGHGSGT